MKKILYFDCFSGISGDMTLGALVHLGVDSKKLIEELKKLDMKEYEITFDSAQRWSVSGVNCNVILEGNTGCRHGHDIHHHDHEHRNFGDICKLISESGIRERAKVMAIAIFRTIAEAEAKVHGKGIEEIHFHEVGAVDSIVDIVGTAICIDMLEIDGIYCSALREGTGFVECRHGMLPVPVPAVMEMLAGSGITISKTDIPMEMVTPTGLGILKGLHAVCDPIPAFRILGTGYGFGKRDTGRLNALRVILCILNEQEGETERVTVMETNLDDESGEILGYTMEKLLDAGALDVFFTPIYMKKNRPAVKLSVISKMETAEAIASIILTETSSLGIRSYEMERIALKREKRMIETIFGPVGIKVGHMGSLEKISPEYEDCARIAREQGIPLTKVYSIAAEACTEEIGETP